MKKLYLLLLAIFFVWQGNAQLVSSYTFSQSSGTYTPITGGVNIPSTAAAGSDDGVTTAAPIGFSFTYNGTAYTQFGINSNGWISLGSAAPSTTNPYTPLSTSPTINIVSGFGVDIIGRQHFMVNRTASSPVLTVTAGNTNNLAIGSTLSGTGITTGTTVVSKTATTITMSANVTSAGTGSQLRAWDGTSGIRYETTGSAPNRKLTVQWTGWSRYITNASTGDKIDFQIVLSETSNLVEIIYNHATPNASGTIAPQVGLKGASAADFYNRTSATSWSATTAGATNADAITYSNLIAPASGLTYTFTPPVPCVGTPTPGNTIASDNQACSGRTVNLSLQNMTAGSGVTYQWQSGTSSSGPWTNIAFTTSTASPVVTATTWYRALVTCSGNTGTSNPVAISLSTSANCYPIVSATNPADEDISNVTVGTLNNTSNNCVNAAPGSGSIAGRYSNYSTTVAAPNLQQSSSVSFSLTMTSCSTNAFGNFFQIYIDYNKDGDFADAGEQVYSQGTSVTSAGHTVTGSFTVPAAATLGITGMRVVNIEATAGTTNYATTSYVYGETEDYIVNITAPVLPDYVNLQFPATATILAGNTATVYGQVYEGGLTDVEPGYSGQAAGIQAWVGVSPIGSNTNPNTWTNWTLATHNAGHVSNNDEYQANIGASLVPGTYYYATRFSLSGGPFVYGGTDGTNGNFWNGTTFNSGVLTVSPNPTQCSGSAISPANGATGVTAGTVAFSWTAPTSGPAPTSYDVYAGTTSGSLTFVANVPGTTANFNVTGYSTTFYWRVVPKSTAGGDATGCAEWSFTTQVDPFLPYCSTVAYSVDVEPITLVNFAGINNTTSNTIDGTPSLENFIAISGNVTTETSYQMTLKGNTGGNFTTNFRVFVDWNQDGDFADVDEIYNGGSVLNSTGIDAVQSQFSILVPATALGGTTRMRIKKLYSADAGVLTNPCTGGQYGQSEDYSLNVTVCTPLVWYADADGDGYGDAEVSQSACNQPVGYILDNTDCDDGLAAVNPGATEVAFNGVDDDCDGTIDEGSQLFSKVLASQCGTTLATINSLIGAVSFGAPVDGYRFRVVNTTTSAVQTIDRTSPNFQLTQLATYDYATTYSISVQLRRNGIWLNYYGDSCLVSTPAILGPGGAASVTPSQCGIVLTNINTLIATTSLQGVTGYRFRITNTTDITAPNQVQTLDRTTHWFSLPMLATYVYGTTYTIEVAVKTGSSTTYSGYGAPCSVSTPVVPVITNPGTAATATSLFYTTSLNRATSYRFQLSLMVAPFTTIIVDRTAHYFSFGNVPGYVPGGQYAVQVAVMTSGVWSPFGEAELVTAPGAARGNFEEEALPTVAFRAVGYPNPYAETFALDMDTSSEENVKVRVYDMLGKLVDDREFAADQIEMQAFGNRYPSGVYNVIVTQGTFAKTLRMVKR
ncbi:MAG: T9SS type A sorting domain-containing protein [Flavobacterium sp.]|uniref:GEVED domain-containing protein n=1 Tax=Flavobacterium sp. TaxID=239 RepID=UPI00121ABF96|nr:GEVED domain-containing protein [Flavobacterium sp.]RZJ65946.1 MAG: T9SS type A sorting domain-containing protein [Flavobacterium sp.]